MLDRRLADRLSGADVGANAEWIRDVEVPDVLRWRDYHAEPEAALEAVRRRFDATGSAVGVVTHFDYPKGESGERSFPVFDPVTELGFRSAVTPVAATLSRTVPARALSRRAEVQRNGAWRAEPWRPVRRRRKKWLIEQERTMPGGGRGAADVRNCFLTINTKRLCSERLPALSCDDYAIRPLRGFLDDLGQLPGHHTGLPFGQEAASILGTAYMSPMDRGAGDAQSIRWVDDLLFAGHSEEQFLDWLGRQAEQAGRLGLALNDAKTAWAPWSEALDQEESLSHLLDESDLFDAFDLLSGAAQDGELGGVPRCLANLAEAGDVRGAAVIRSYPWLAERLPRQSAQYIKAVWSRTNDGFKDWVCTLAAPGGGASPPLRLHLLHSLRRELSGRLDSASLFDSGIDLLTDRGVRPLACETVAAAVAGGNKAIWSAAIDVAFDQGDLNAQRALVGELPAGNITTANRRGVQELARRSPGLLPLAAKLAA